MRMFVALAPVATLGFLDQEGIFLGGVEVRMLYFGRGHTNGDTSSIFPICARCTRATW